MGADEGMGWEVEERSYWGGIVDGGDGRRALDRDGDCDKKNCLSRVHDLLMINIT
jgi:hypothetical protein